MTLRTLVHLGLVAFLPLAACAQGENPPAGPSFKVQVAPLTVDDATNACYRITVTNGEDRTGEIVWQQDSICADDYGDGAGAITYVGTCDANVTGPNSVTLELLDLYTDEPPVAVDDDEYVNPCGRITDWTLDRGDITGEDPEDQNGPCTINRVCQDNADVLVEFDLTIMRDADQGFFDVAVEFEDIFCSAKLDCNPAFLHDQDGDRNATAIVAFACTSGENEETFLHVSDLVLICTGGATPVTITIPADPSPGNHGPISGGVFQSAVYVGDEQLTSNGAPLEKRYWNRAIGLDRAQLQGPCTLSGAATASTTPDVTTRFDDPGEIYPVITWSVEVLDGDNSLCGEQRLDDDAGGVRSTYVDGDPANSDATNVALRKILGTAWDLPPRRWCPDATQLGLDDTGATDVSSQLDALVDVHDCLNLRGTFRLEGDVSIDVPTLYILGRPTFAFAKDNVFFSINASDVHIKQAKFDGGHHSFGAVGRPAPILVGPKLDRISLVGSEFFDIDGKAMSNSTRDQTMQYALHVSANKTRIDLTGTYFHHITQVAPDLHDGLQWCDKPLPNDCEWKTAAFCGGVFITHDFADGYEPGGEILIRDAKFEEIVSQPNPNHNYFKRNGDAIRSYVFMSGSNENVDAVGTKVIVERTTFYNIDTSSVKLANVAAEIRDCNTTSDLEWHVEDYPEHPERWEVIDVPMYAAYRTTHTSNFVVENVEAHGRIRNVVVVDGTNIQIDGVKDFTTMPTANVHKDRRALNTVQIGISSLTSHAVIKNVWIAPGTRKASGIYLKDTEDVEIEDVEAPGSYVGRLLNFHRAKRVRAIDFSMEKGILFSFGLKPAPNQVPGDTPPSVAEDIELSNGTLTDFIGTGVHGSYIQNAQDITLTNIQIAPDCSGCTNLRLELDDNQTEDDITKIDCNF